MTREISVLNITEHSRIYRANGYAVEGEYYDGRFSVTPLVNPDIPNRTLSPTETVVLACRALGCSQRQVTDYAGLSASAVNNATGRIRERLGVVPRLIPQAHMLRAVGMNVAPVISNAFTHGVLKTEAPATFDNDRLDASDRYTWGVLAVRTGLATLDDPLTPREVDVFAPASVTALLGKLGVESVAEAITLYHLTDQQ